MTNYKTTITKYSLYDKSNYSIKSMGNNVAKIFDKLIDIAACKCDKYGSDIFWDMKSLYDCIEEQKDFDRLLFFREMGVHSINVYDLKNYSFLDIKTLTEEKYIWRLQYKKIFDEETDQIEWEISLTRVNLRVEAFQ